MVAWGWQEQGQGRALQEQSWEMVRLGMRWQHGGGRLAAGAQSAFSVCSLYYQGERQKQISEKPNSRQRDPVTLLVLHKCV